MKPRDIEQGPWEDALTEAREAMIATVRSAKGMIAYGDLTSKITALRMAPDSHALRELLGDVSRAENTAGRGMLSVVVVHKDGPNRGRPGNGFFTLAQELGHDTHDREKFWISEFEKVRKFWKDEAAN
jgi:hypothetical protein